MVQWLEVSNRVSIFHEQLLKQNLDLREALEKSLTEMEELKKFQGSTFDTIAWSRLVEDQDTILELTGKIQELQNCKMKFIVSMIREIEFVRSVHSTLPVNLCLSHLVQFLVEC